MNRKQRRAAYKRLRRQKTAPTRYVFEGRVTAELMDLATSSGVGLARLSRALDKAVASVDE